MWLADLLDAFPGRLVSEIEAEIDRQPVGWVEEVLEARAYRNAKWRREEAEKPGNEHLLKALPMDGLSGLVTEIDEDIWRESRKEGGDE